MGWLGFWLALILWLLNAAGASAAVRVLYLGDSFSKGAFGKTLDATMRAAGLEVYTSVTGGASAYDWLPEYGPTSSNIGYWEKTPKSERRVTYIARVPKLDEMVARWRPHVVVIQGGTNMYSVLTSKRRTKEGNVAELERLLGRMGDICAAQGAKLYWITPASAHPKRFSPELQAEMNAILHRVVGRYGKVFNSYAVTTFKDPYPGTDGIHYGPTDAARWAQLVARDLVPYAQSRASRTYARGQERGQEDTEGKRRSLWDFLRRRDRTDKTDKADKIERAALGGRSREIRPPAPRPAPEPPPAPPVEPASPAVRPSSPPSSSAPVPVKDRNVLEVEVILRSKPEKRMLSEITYRSALGIFEYDVVRVIRGHYEPKKIRLAHLIVMNKRYTSMIDRPLGSRMTLAVEPLSNYPNLEKLQTIDDLEPAYDLPIFIPKL